jgi:hypothetical protein
MVDSVTLVLEQYRRIEEQVRVVVLHPNFPSQHQLLSLVLGKCEYVRFSGQDLSDDALDAQLAAAWGIKKLKSTALLVLDEVDRAKPEALTRLVVEKLLPKVGRGRIVLMGRSLPVDLLHHPKLRGQVALLPIDPDHLLANYLDRPENAHLLEVWGLGSGRVAIDGREILQWDGVLPRALFFYLVDRGMATRSEIFASFWPTLSVREATNVFHVTKRKVNEVLGTDLTTFKSSYYYLAPEIHLQYDVSRFNFYVQESADLPPDEAEAHLREAVTLMRGQFIRSLSLPWVVQRREEIKVAYAEALLMLGRLVEARGDSHDALQWCMRAFHQLPVRSDIAEATIELCARAGLSAQGKEIYKLHRSALATSEHKKVTDAVRKAAAALG